MFRVHGHSSAYTAYECMHQPTYSSVFNITNNYGCGGGCGGGFVAPKMNFWNSFAYGLGNGFSSMFSGFGGMFGNMFGGMGMFGGGMGMFPMFGMGNMFGGGMGMFPWFNMFGGGGSTSSTSSKTSTGTCSCGCSGTGSGNFDSDVKNIDWWKKQVAGVTDETTAKTLYKQIKSLVESPLDSVDKDKNIEEYKKLLAELETKYPSLKTEGGSSSNGASSSNGTNGTTDAGIIAAWDDIPSGAFPGLSDDMKAKLQNIGVKPKQINGKWYLSLPTDMKADNIKILAKSGLPVAVAKNSKANDKWIIGKISAPDDISDDKDKYNWSIDCDGSGGSYKNKYKVTKGEAANVFNIKLEEARTNGYTLNDGAEYEFSDGELCMTRNEDDVLFTTQNKSSNNKYKKVTTES